MMVMLVAIGLSLAGCGQQKAAEKYHPARLEDTDQKDVKRVILDAKAASRTGIETAVVREQEFTVAGTSAMRKVIPYGALMYDKKGHGWTYTSPQELVYVRQPVVVERVIGNDVILAEGPATGTVIVTVGAAELMGAEHKYGH
jgi:hypothetical protein